MSGFQEILLLVIIIMVIFYLPRVISRGKGKKQFEHVFTLSGKMRLAIATSVFWPLLMAVVIKPWQKNMPLFFYIGFGPVAFGWIMNWVLHGFRNSRN
ncbi:MAG: hypothetical protein ACE5DO_03410 [Desulfobacterales bacterium]